MWIFRRFRNRGRVNNNKSWKELFASIFRIKTPTLGVRKEVRGSRLREGNRVVTEISAKIREEEEGEGREEEEEVNRGPKRSDGKRGELRSIVSKEGKKNRSVGIEDAAKARFQVQRIGDIVFCFRVAYPWKVKRIEGKARREGEKGRTHGYLLHAADFHIDSVLSSLDSRLQKLRFRRYGREKGRMNRLLTSIDRSIDRC